MTRPAGYCGATSSIFQSGTNSAPASRPHAMIAGTSHANSGFPNNLVTAPPPRKGSHLKVIAPSRWPREGSIPVFPLIRLHEEPAGHLQVEGRTELRAVEVVRTRLVGDEVEVRRLSRLQARLDVVLRDGEPVRGVLGLLDVRHVQYHAVALLDADDVRREVAALRRHPDLDGVAVTDDLLFAELDGVLARLHRDRVGPRCIQVKRLQLVGLHDLRVVRL